MQDLQEQGASAVGALCTGTVGKPSITVILQAAWQRAALKGPNLSKFYLHKARNTVCYPETKFPS